MIPVKQTKYGRGNGNCLAACVASILCVNIDNIPDFNVDGYWFEELKDFCYNTGLSLIHWNHSEFNKLIVTNCHLIAVCELKGEEELHAVIGKAKIISVSEDGKYTWEFNIEHDPNQIGTPPLKGIVSFIHIAKQ